MNSRWPHNGHALRGREPRGLYLITPELRDTAQLVARVAAVLDHAALLQYRNKQADDALRRGQITALLPLCRAARVPLVVNDDWRLAQALGADGVHLGRDDEAPREARALLGEEAIIGVSCYGELARAEAAAAAGASYVAFGAFFASPTKPGAARASPELLRRSAQLGLPRVAIGGINADNAGRLVAAGAEMVAVISGVFDAPDPVAAARAVHACFD